MHLLHVNGHDMAYVEQGKGAPLLLLHGAMCGLRYWASQMETFGRRYRTIAPSLRHFWPERWDGVGDDFTIQQHTEDVAAFVAALGAGPAHLVGHSRDGHVAFRVAQRFPNRIRTLILAERDCLMFGGQAAAAKPGCVSFAGVNLCPKSEPKVPL